MSRFQIVPRPARQPGFNLGLSMPARPVAAPSVACEVAALWKPLEQVATSVGVSSGFDPPSYGSQYADGTFTCVHSTNHFGQWEIDTTGIATPIVCAAIIKSGELLDNVSFLIGNSQYLWINPGPTLSPYFLLAANTPGQSIQFYEDTQPGAGGLATPVSFRVLALPLTLP